MGVLTELLAAHRDTILERFTARLQASAGRADAELGDHLPELLAAIARALAADDPPADGLCAAPLRPGVDVDAVVREYALLHDCILELLEASGAAPSLRELRVLLACVDAATAAALRHHADECASAAALRASEERYRSLFESIDNGFCLMQMILDADGETVDYRFLETNAAFESETGLTGAVGKTARELVPTLDESWFRLYGRVAATGEPARFEKHAPAMGRWFDVYASRVGTPELRQVALVFKDVTERRRAEEERAQLFAREREAREEAEAASRLKDDFLATVSHELRTPLTAILGWARMLRADDMPPERRNRGIETIERNARAQAQLIEDLLDVSSILVGKLRLAVAPVDVRVIVTDAIDTIRPAADAKNIRLQAALAADGTVMGDPQRLQQAVWNLLSNAVKFTPKGGGVHVLVERHDGSVDITVADTGRGIEPAFQPHAFEHFRQASSATTPGGLGLGLAIVRQIVELHGGTVSVFSEGEGHGSRFTLHLPLTASPPP